MLNSGTRHNSQVIKATKVLIHRAMAEDNVDTPHGSHTRSGIMSSSAKSSGKWHQSRARLRKVLSVAVIGHVTRRNLRKSLFWLVVPESVHNGGRGNIAGRKSKKLRDHITKVRRGNQKWVGL